MQRASVERTRTLHEDRQPTNMAASQRKGLDRTILATAMTDTISPSERSHRMALIRGRNTRPELLVRRLIHGLGYRYRLNRKDLPGSPDLVFPARRAVIFVHGCFWHRHPDPFCPLARLPKSRREFWLPKLEANRVRDVSVLDRLRIAEWRVLTVWECELRYMEAVEGRIVEFLGPPRDTGGAKAC